MVDSAEVPQSFPRAWTWPRRSPGEPREPEKAPRPELCNGNVADLVTAATRFHHERTDSAGTVPNLHGLFVAGERLRSRKLAGSSPSHTAASGRRNFPVVNHMAALERPHSSRATRRQVGVPAGSASKCAQRTRPKPLIIMVITYTTSRFASVPAWQVRCLRIGAGRKLGEC